MRIDLIRFHDDGDTTCGLLYIDDVFECFIVEDQENTVKKYGETRIPEGIYDVSLRREGTFHQRYKKKFGQNDGMLCIHNAKDWRIVQGDTVFQYVLIHIGNSDDDTAGCLLPNDSFSVSTMRGSGSTVAYQKLYKKVSKALLNGDKCKIYVRKIEK